MREKMMNMIAEAVREEFGSECEVQLEDVTKNNGLVRKAVIIREPGMTAAPMVYIDEMLDRFMSGSADVREVAQDIVRIYRKYMDKGDFGKIVNRLSRQSILEGVTYQLINAEKNEGRLANMPHKRFLDLAVVYRVIVGEDEMGTASFLIGNGLMEHKGLGEEELDNAAQRNTERHGFKTMSMEPILAENTDILKDEIKTDCPMWILTNTKALNGAVVMLYPKIFKDLADMTRSNLYVLPSSIHEVIAVPDYGFDSEKLKSMVGYVNSNEVSEDEFLSGNVYNYIRKENRLVIV